MTIKEKIYNQLAAMGKGSINLRTVEKRLNLQGQSDRRILAQILRELEKEGRVFIDKKNNLTVRKAKLIEGNLKGNRRGFAFLLRTDGGEDIFIPNRALNGALHGDTVFARLTGESEGEVVSIIKRGIVRLIGTYFSLERFGYIKPDNTDYFKDIYVAKGDEGDAKTGTKVVVDVEAGDGSRPSGVVTEVLGRAGERATEVLAILRSYDFQDKFPENVVNAAKRMRYTPDFEGREDLRELTTITIDGEDAKDFDDAISIIKTKGGYKLYVHIADVSHYVKSGSVIDKEAYIRGTSVYFPSSVYPMLPEEISNGVCSLLPGEEKLTLTAELDFDAMGAVTRTNFYKSVIRSDYRMTYTAVTAILEGDTELKAHYNSIADMIENAAELAKILAAKRTESGAINFETKESIILLDDKGGVIDIRAYAHGLSNSLIEQFMVAANEAVARFLYDKKCPSVYRIHGAPTELKLKGFTDFINALGYKINLPQGASPKIFSDFLLSVKGEPAETVINKTLLRAMQKAHYSTDNAGHFGLNSEYYCHFTSPIRRYPDLMVHRALKAVIEKKDGVEFRTKFFKSCYSAAAQSSERELAAERAERDIDDYYKAVYMSDKIGERYTGTISGIIGAGIFVMLDNTVEGFISVDDLPDDRYDIDSKLRLSGIKYLFAIGTKIDVIIKSASPEARKIDMSFDGDANAYLRKDEKSKNRTASAVKKAVSTNTRKPAERKGQQGKRKSSAHTKTRKAYKPTKR
ncbi:MAG: ribonuclease R [Clostridia bacterium]